VTAQQPSGEEVEIGTVVTTPPQLLAQNTPPVKSTSPATTSAPAASKLPATASSLPLVALLGLIFVTAGFLLHFVQRKLG
jgi:hypothetical protein